MLVVTHIMRGNQLDNYLHSLFTRHSTVQYLGLFDLDKFDPHKAVTSNTLFFAALNWKNEHWISIFAGDGFVVFADSLARDVRFYSEKLSQSLQELYGPERLLHIPFQVQPWRSKTCAFFLLYWAYLLSKGKSFASLSAGFSSTNLRNNNQLITRWMHQRFPSYFIH